MRARAVAEYLRSLDSGWVDWHTTVDHFVAGDPEQEVTGIAVGWMAYTAALQRAHGLGCNLFVTHEPTLFDHRDDPSALERFPGVREKRAWLEASRLIVLRCHDVWDQAPELGIPDSWGSFLELGEPVRADGYFRLYRIEARPAREVAAHVAGRVRSLGQAAVELVGPGDREVCTVAIGTGAISPLPRLLDLYEPDLAICSDDGFTYWHAGALAIDLGIPVVVVNHAVTELPGIQSLARTLRERFPDVPVHYLAQAAMYRLISK